MTKKTLWVCWKEPNYLPAANAVILSFLRPSKEEELKKKFSGELISARQIAPQIKDKARKIYIDIIANIGIVSSKEGKTLREALKRKDGVSLWWFHPVSHKDCESDSTFQFIIEILTIISAVNSLNTNDIVFYGGYKELAEVLRSIWKIREIKCRKKTSRADIFFKGLTGRLKYLFAFLLQGVVIKKCCRAPQGGGDIVFSGFWNWSVKENKDTYELEDNYFKSLPDKLTAAGIKIGWFLWAQLPFHYFFKKDKLKQILDPFKRHTNLVVLQHLLTAREGLKALVNFRPYFIFLSFCRTNSFKEAFIRESIDFYPLLRSPLIYGFINSNIPNFELIYSSSQKAFKKYKPKVSLTFLELFLHSRAFYMGAKLGSSKTVNCAMQHASYSREKTFIVLDPEIEYGIWRDNCSIPKPDYIFAMGELGKEIFMESGFPEDKVILTGSSRYEHIKRNSINPGGKMRKIKNILMVTTVARDLEMEMIDAVCLAAKGLPQLRLLLRNHPFVKMQEYADFRGYKNKITITKGSLEEDLNNADLIVFSYSTVAEEALIRGIPVWQWLPVSYNGSVFRDLKVIPVFNSVAGLRESLKRFIEHPELFILDEATKDVVSEKCFHITNENVNKRIADYLINEIIPHQRQREQYSDDEFSFLFGGNPRV